MFLGDTTISMYVLFNVLAVIAVFIYAFAQVNSKKTFLSNISICCIESFVKNKKTQSIFAKTSFWAIVELFIFAFIQYAPASFLNSFFAELVGTGTNYFGLIFFIPIISFVFYFFVSINPFKQYDLLVPAYPMALTLGKLGCFLRGCCRGIECSYGLYNYSSEQYEFPVQLLEMFFAIGIFAFLVYWRKHASEGTLFPIYVILYSVTRFFSEFMRCEESLFWGLKKYQWICIVGVLVGIVEFVIVKKYRDNISYFYESHIIFPKINFYKIALKLKLIKEKNIVHHKNKKNNK